MIAEGVQHDIAGAETGREQRPRAAPGIGVNGLGLEDRTGRGEQPSKRARKPGDEAAEGRGGLVQGREFRLAQHRQAGQRRPAGDAGGIDALEALGIGRRRHRLAQHVRQPRKQLRLAHRGGAGFAGVIMVGHLVVPSSQPPSFRDASGASEPGIRQPPM